MTVNKICTGCKINKPSTDFYKTRYNRNGLASWCKKCVLTQQKEKFEKDPIAKAAKQAYRTAYYHNHKPYYKKLSEKCNEKNSDKYYRNRIFKAYRITSQQLDLMLESQNNVCAICLGKPTYKTFKNLSVDHCHETGKVRGLLCNECNLGLGKFKDSSKYLILAAEYLKGFGK